MRQTVNPGMWCFRNEIEGKTISWHYAKDMRSVGIFVLGIVAAALMLVLEKTE